jgi:inner membrane protein
MQDSVERIASSIRSSQMLRLFSVGILALLLQVPIALIGGLVSERQGRRQAAVAEVSSSWGNAQVITGPALVVPYTHRWTEASTGGQPITRTEARNAIFLPERLEAHGTIDSEIRSRGIFLGSRLQARYHARASSRVPASPSSALSLLP